MNPRISLPLAYGDETKTLEIEWMPGGGGCWSVLVDRYHYGKVRWQGGEWRPHIDSPEFTTVDIQMIVDLIKEQMPDGPPYGLL